MARIKGVVVGIVVDVNDPNGEGRIRVDFPWIGGQNKLYWAPVATMMTGNGRGSWFMPEVGDEVLVAFEHEDAEHPFVLGFLWNGKDKPPETSSHKRLIKSVKGHTILLDDNDGSEKIEVTTSGNSKITMDDPNKSITITTSGGLKITMDDTSNSITIQASKSVTVESNEATVKASTVAVNASSISLGEGASQPAVLGTNLVAYLNELIPLLKSHIHPGTGGGPAPVVTSPSPVLAPLLPPPPTVLSQHIMEA